MLSTNNLFKLKNSNRKDSVEKANSYPIQEMIPNIPTKKTGKTLMCCCPFHNEQKPSFAIYPETNSWFCFAGCGGGDAISFYMKLNNVDFKTAVENLTTK